MKILVTGGCGFIGTNLCLSLKAKGYKITALDNFSKDGSKENANILNRSKIPIWGYDLRKQIPKEKFKFDAVFHLAGNGSTPKSIKDPYGDFLDTALGTLNILETVRTNKTPLVYTSTCKIYSSELNIVPTKVTETRYIWNFKSPLYKKLRLSIKEAVSKFGVNEYFPVDSVGKFAHAPYGVSHATGDLYCQEYFLMYQVPVVINRMSTIYGFYQQGSENQGFIDWMVKSKIKNESLNLETNGKSVRDILWVDDLTDLFLEELVQIAKVKGNVFNIGGGNKNTITIRETFKYLDSKYGGRTKLKFGPGRPADQKIYITDIRKVKKTLNWSPKTSAYNGIDRLLNWYKMPKP